jgi:hypothetical protein
MVASSAESEYTNGEVKTMICSFFDIEPEDVQGYVVLMLDKRGRIPMMSSAAHDAMGRQAEIMLLLGALSQLSQNLTTELCQYKKILESVGLLLPPEESELCPEVGVGTTGT